MNPYAPPATLETEATPSVNWRCFGERVMARDGTVLPKVDLETGVSEGEMLAVARNYRPSTPVFLIAVIALILLAAWGVEFATIHLVIIFGIISLAGIILKLRGKKNGSITIWEYRETSRQIRYLSQKRWRQSISYTSVLLFILGIAFGDKITPLLPNFPVFSIFTLITIFLGNVVWERIMRPKTRTESTPTLGWLRIRNVHPEAMRKLREIELTEIAKNAECPTKRTRKVFTRYFHRFPLAALLGNRQRNLFHSAVITLMKLFRSANLERATFHFDESFVISETEISPALRSSLDAWRLAHADWQLLKIERLPSPAGDLTMDTAIVASPRLEHILHLSHTLSPQNSPPYADCEFVTYLQSGRKIYTSSLPIIEIGRTDVDSAQAKGNHLQIFQAHLARCVEHPMAPANDLHSLLARLHDEKAEAHALLEAAGYQGPTQEISI